MRFVIITIYALAALIFSGTEASWGAPARVDANILIGVDVSGSIDDDAERLELAGLAETLVHPAFLHAVQRGAHGSIGFAAFTWSSQDDFMLVVPWERIETAAHAERIAERLRRLRPADRFPRHSYAQGGQPWRTSLDTDVSAAIEVATGMLDSAPFSSGRRLLNLCANGADNIGTPPDLARDAAVAAGITINGLILSPQPEVAEYFRDHVQGGPGAFVMTVLETGDIVASMLTKFVLELADDWRVPNRSHGGHVIALAGML